MAYWIYMMGSSNGNALYTGVTNDLYRRVTEHKLQQVKGFTKQYNCVNLLYYEKYQNIMEAISREKEIKGWTRDKKEDLIRMLNPERNDLLPELSQTDI